MKYQLNKKGKKFVEGTFNRKVVRITSELLKPCLKVGDEVEFHVDWVGDKKGKIIELESYVSGSHKVDSYKWGVHESDIFKVNGKDWK